MGLIKHLIPQPCFKNFTDHSYLWKIIFYSFIIPLHFWNKFSSWLYPINGSKNSLSVSPLKSQWHFFIVFLFMVIICYILIFIHSALQLLNYVPISIPCFLYSHSSSSDFYYFLTVIFSQLCNLKKDENIINSKLRITFNHLSELESDYH